MPLTGSAGTMSHIIFSEDILKPLVPSMVFHQLPVRFYNLSKLDLLLIRIMPGSLLLLMLLKMEVSPKITLLPPPFPVQKQFSAPMLPLATPFSISHPVINQLMLYSLLKDRELFVGMCIVKRLGISTCWIWIS
jgi:hypothetical protein